MGKILLTLYVLLLSGFCSVSAQPVLYGLTSEGGSRGGGALIKLDPSSNQLTAHFNWNPIGQRPFLNDLVEYKGKLYGMTLYGSTSSSSFGTIFSYDPISKIYTLLFDFNNFSGAGPCGSLLASGGKLFGMTRFGGRSNDGTIFSFDPVTNTHTKLFDFNKTNGASPYGSLIEYDGKLYGMTSEGGSSNNGTIFSFDPVNNIHTNLLDFDGTNGSNPNGSLVVVGSKLYGMTKGGGVSKSGTIFSFNPVINTHTKLFDFNNANGINPYGSLVFSGNKLYGVTQIGGIENKGTIFSFDPTINNYTKLFDFNNTKGALPYGSLIEFDGKLYGMTSEGGKSNNGTIFSFDTVTNFHTNLFDFDNTSGINPKGSLWVTEGKLYGMTGGNEGSGSTLFSFDPLSNTHTKLCELSNTNGSNPTGSLVLYMGKFYGTTRYGNTGSTIFSFDPITNTHTKLFNFVDTNNSEPNGTLVVVGGKLFGTTQGGGSGNAGTIFSFDLLTNTHTKLFDFSYDNGGSPNGSLVEEGGKLYGMTRIGGNFNSGVIFSFDLVKNNYSKLFDFSYGNGSYPNGGLLVLDGKLYGMTSGDVSFSSNGTIFSFDPSKKTYTKLFDFSGTNGSTPYASLLVFGGKLYGMTERGGSSGLGTIFSFDPITGMHNKLFDFSSLISGVRPLGNLTESFGQLYGMTSRGGSNDKGTVFSYDPANNTFTKLHDFIGGNGASPSSGSSFVEYNPNPTLPFITITSPINGSIFNQESNINLNAYTSIPGGTISYVSFFEHGKKLGTDSTAPYSFTGRSVAPGTYRVSAIAITNTGDTLRSDTINVNVLAGCISSGNIFGEGYINIIGSAVADLTSDPSYPGNPNVSAQLSSFEYSNLGDQYGGRLRGYVCAPVTGEYLFYVSGDDQAGLWVSTDDNPANKQLVAYATTFTGFRQWDKFTTQQSQPIHLIAGQRYYVETLHKEYIDGDHLSVGWRLPDGTFERPISGNRLSPYITGGIGGQALSNGFAQDMRAALNMQLTATVLPNPSRNTFTVSLKGKEGSPIQAVVTDILGRVIETKRNLQPNGQLQMGQNWKPGIYILQLQQGDQRTILKLIKE